MKRTNVEAEKNELILQNESGDYAIIPANRRNEVLQLLEQGCYDCIDSIVASLPSTKDYAQDGTVIDNDPIYSGGTFNTVTTTAQAPNWLKYQREFNTKNPFNLEQEVQRRFDNPMGREAIDKIDEKGFKAKLEQEVLQRRTRQENKYIAQQLIKNIPQGKMSRAKWLDSLSDKEEEIVKSVFPKYQSSLWTDTKRGLQSLVETNPIQAFTNIAKSKDYSTREKREMLKEYIDHPMMSKVSDAAKILNPLLLPAKMVQSAYKDEYSFLDAVKGAKNDASLLEEIATDPLNLVGIGLLKKGATSKELIKAYRDVAKLDNVGRESLLDIGVQSLSDKYSIPDKDKLIQALKGTDNILSQFVGELMQGGANRQAIKKGNDWLENWIKNPATQKKIEDDIREALSYPIGYTAETTLNLVKEQAKSFKPNSKEFSLMKQLEDNIKQYISKDKTKKPIHSNNYGVSYTHYKDARYRKAVEEGLEIPDDVYGSWISRSSNIPQSKRELTTIHEGTHDWASNEVLRVTEQYNYISSRLNKDIFNKDQTTNLTSKQIDYLKYLAQPTEVHARIMELRRYFNLSPETKLTPQQTLDMVRTLQKLPKNQQPIDVKGFLYVIDQGDLKQNVLNLTSLFNRLWAVPAAVIGTQAVQAQSDDNEIKAEEGLVVSNTNPPKEAIDNLLKKYNSPMTADDFLYVSNQTGIGVDALLGQALLESSFGTKGKGARANNPLNWGNDDLGNIRTYGSYREGLLTAAQGLKEKFYFTTPEDFIERGFKGKYGIYATDPDYKTKYTNYINQVRKDLGMSGIQTVVPGTQQQQVAVPTMPDISSLFQLPNENVRIINAPSISGNIPSVSTGSAITTEDKLNIPKEELLALKQRFTMQGYTPSNSYFDKDILKMAFLDNAGKLGKYDQFPLDDVSLQKLANTLKSTDNAM